MPNLHSTLPRQQGFDVHFPDRKFAIDWCIAYLRDNEFAVTHVPDGRFWETPKQLHARLAPTMQRTTFHRRLHHPARPAFISENGPGGRLLRLKTTHALEEWLTRPTKKTPEPSAKEVFHV